MAAPISAGVRTVSAETPKMDVTSRSSIEFRTWFPEDGYQCDAAQPVPNVRKLSASSIVMDWTDARATAHSNAKIAVPMRSGSDLLAGSVLPSRQPGARSCRGFNLPAGGVQHAIGELHRPLA